MKKSLILSFLALLPIAAHAQFFIESSGKAAFGILQSASNPLQSALSIGDYGRSDSYVTVNAENKNNGLYITRSGGTPYTTHSVITALNTNLWGLTTNYGIYTTTINSTPIYDSCKAIGLYSIAGNCREGNWGVAGIVDGESSFPGVGVMGSSSNSLFSPGGRYAGAFFGNVLVAANLTASSFTTSSDFRLKDNIQSLTRETALDNVLKMNAVSYNLKQRDITFADGKQGQYYEEGSPLLENIHYGLIAQELQEIYPELVLEGGDGYLSINYTEIIPLLIQSIQELKGEIDVLKNRNAPTRGDIQADGTKVELATVLYQNNPNPFKESTEIKCDIAAGVQEAVLYLYDMNGRQISRRPITQRGHTSVTIEGGSLKAGIYLYSLIADGTVIDTRRMILTK